MPASTSASASALRSPQAAGVFAATALGFLATGATLPVLPQYVDGPLGEGNVAVGLVTGAFAVAAILTRPGAGRYTDRHGSRPAMLLGTGAMVLSGLLMFAGPHLAWVLLSRLGLGIGEGFLFTAASAWIVGLAPASRRGQIIGLFGLSVWGGLTVGTAVGQALHGLAGFDAVWAFALVTPLAAVGLCLLLHEAPRPGGGGAAGDAPPARLAVRALALPGSVLALGNFGYAAFISFIVLDVGAHGGAVVTIYAATVVGSRLVLGRLPDLVGPRRCAIASALGEAAGLAVIAAAQTWWVAACGAVLMAAGFSLLYPALAILVLDQAGEQRRGAAMGIFTAFFDAGMGLGAPLAGIVVSLASYSAAFWTAGVLSGAGALLLIRSAQGVARGPVAHGEGAPA